MTTLAPTYIFQPFISKSQRDANQILGRKTTLSTLESSLRRHESLITTVAKQAEQSAACKEGCSYCCSYCRVFMTPAEVFLLKQHLIKTFSRAKLDAFIASLSAIVDEISVLNSDVFYNINIDCVFLKQNLCNVYDVRPFSCRNYHATDVEGCIETYNEPESNINLSFVSELFVAGNGFAMGVMNAYENKGYDVNTYELHSALLEALTGTHAEKRWMKKKNAFLTAITEASRVPSAALKQAV